MVVEDNPLLRELLGTMLSALGCTACEARSGEEAIAMLRQGIQISMLITDIQMPGGMTGIELAEVVREEFSAIKVVLMSGLDEPLNLPAQISYLPKPFTAKILQSVVQS